MFRDMVLMFKLLFGKRFSEKNGDLDVFRHGSLGRRDKEVGPPPIEPPQEQWTGACDGRCRLVCESDEVYLCLTCGKKYLRKSNVE